MSIKHFDNVVEYLTSEGVDDRKINKLAVLPSEFVDCNSSSYKSANYSLVFSYLVRKHQPKRVAEFGVLGCYSLLSFALAAKKNLIDCELFGYDLFEDYPYTKFKLSDAESLVCKYAENSSTHLCKTNVFNSGVIQEELDKSDLIHVDLSNDGDVYEYFLSRVPDKNLCLIFEGGSKERDLVEWMINYRKKPIGSVLKSFSKSTSLSISVINEFPSLTIVTKRG